MLVLGNEESSEVKRNSPRISPFLSVSYGQLRLATTMTRRAGPQQVEGREEKM